MRLPRSLILPVAVLAAPAAFTLLSLLHVGASTPAAYGDGTVHAEPGACPRSQFFDRGSAGGSYPRPSLRVSCTGSTVSVRTNDIPNYRFVQITPNPLKSTPIRVSFPRHPRVASGTTATPYVGIEGIAVNGIILATPAEGANPVSQAYGDPVYNYQLDRCLGHTGGEYHYHAFHATCFHRGGRRPSPVLGYALDGFPIYGPRGCLDRACRHVVTFRSGYVRRAGQSPQTRARSAYAWQRHSSRVYLDRCNGRIGPDGTYRYYATYAYPYIIGCYRGAATGSIAYLNGGPGMPFGHEQTVGYGCTLTATGNVRCRRQGPPR